MKDDEMDELLIRGARDYNEPGAVPREEMWARIAEARRTATRGVQRPAATRRWAWIVGGIAATLVLSGGIAIGRRLERAAPRGPTTAAVPAPPTKTATIPAAAESTTVERLHDETNKTGQRIQRLASVEPTTATPNAAAARGTAPGEPSLAYRLVVLQHLAGSEAMITAFRAAARRGEVDAQIAAWSRDLLSTTRMLEASPVKEDPTMKRLLEDLDLVIVQIAQYTTRGTVDPDDLDLIERSIVKRGVLNKLRTTLPVRNTPAGL